VLRYSGPQHVVTVAPSRTGKGVCAIVPNLLLLDDRSLLVIDPKGENAAIAARRRRAFGPVHLLNPFNEHGMGTARFNPLAHLSIDHPNIVADVAGIAEALIVADGNATHWSDSARTLVQIILLHLIATRPGTASLIDMRGMLGQSGEKFGGMIHDMLNSPHGFIANRAAQFEEPTKEVQSIISTARTQTAFLDDPAIAHVLSGSDFAMLDLKARPTTIFIILPSRFLVAYARFFRLLVVSALDQLQSQPGGVQTTLILDEFAALGKLSAIETAFGQAAGFRVQLWPFLQDLNQLKSLYGDKWETFLANAGVIQWFTPNDMFTADYLSRRFGQKTVLTTSTSISENSRDTSSSSTSLGETARPLKTAAELMGMEPVIAMLTLSGLRFPVEVSRVPYYFTAFGDFDLASTYPKFAGLYDPNPFHPGAPPVYRATRPPLAYRLGRATRRLFRRS
jgi:type IV secretion system protein VirD4